MLPRSHKRWSEKEEEQAASLARRSLHARREQVHLEDAGRWGMKHIQSRS